MLGELLFKIVLTVFLVFEISYAEKIKDISNIVGVRSNQLIGYGLIVGLNGTGDSSSQFTNQSLANMLQSVNVKVDANQIKSKNVAAVMVTTMLPPFARQGDKVDIVISSIGDAKSLQGGTLLLTPLKAVDGKIYALGQGPISIGGGAGGGAGGASNHPLVGSIMGGGVVEKELTYDLYNKKNATLSLKESNFANAVTVQNNINKFYGNKVARAIDPRTIKLLKPDEMSMVEFLASVQDVNVNYTRSNRIVIDERTGTVVAGVAIKVEPVVVTHGDITIKIAALEEDSTNNGAGSKNINLGNGVSIATNTNTLSSAQETPTVADITRALQKLGATPTDVIAILQAMKKAGAISVDLEII